MSTFAITGWPRSRTAWLSNLFTTGDVFCQHDMLRKSAPDEWAELLLSLGTVHGFADAGLPLLLNRAQEAGILEGPILVVSRQPGEALRAIEAAFGAPLPKRLVAEHRWGLNTLRKWKRTLDVPFENLDDVATLKMSWHHLVGSGVPFDASRAEELIRMNVQARPEKMLEGLAAHWR